MKAPRVLMPRWRLCPKLYRSYCMDADLALDLAYIRLYKSTTYFIIKHLFYKVEWLFIKYSVVIIKDGHFLLLVQTAPHNDCC